LFADDLLIFAKATSSEASAIKDCLDLYCQWSGQAVNTAKSSIMFSKNTASSAINGIKEILPFKSTATIASYLGLHFSLENQKRKLLNLYLQEFWGDLKVGVLKLYLKQEEQCSSKPLHPLYHLIQ
jgi:hypothetical protein